MNKPTFTALYGLLVILVFFGISASIQACGGKKKAAEDVEEDLSSRAEALADTYSEDEIFEDEDESEASYTSDEDDSNNNNSSYTSDDDNNTSYTSPPVSSSRARSGAPHLVVAGNYLLEDNADKMIRDLNRKGFTSAEKVVFDLSQYYTVIAGRYANRAEASRRAGELKRSGIDTYVITK